MIVVKLRLREEAAQIRLDSSRCRNADWVNEVARALMLAIPGLRVSTLAPPPTFARWDLTIYREQCPVDVWSELTPDFINKALADRPEMPDFVDRIEPIEDQPHHLRVYCKYPVTSRDARRLVTRVDEIRNAVVVSRDDKPLLARTVIDVLVSGPDVNPGYVERAIRRELQPRVWQ